MEDKRSIYIDGVEQPYSRLTFPEQKAAHNYGLVPIINPELPATGPNDTNIRTFIERKTNITKLQNWSHMNMSTAQGGALLDAAYSGDCFDGRYIYFVPSYSDTFVRFDTQGVFTTASDWQQMNMSTAQGGATLDTAYYDACFDGRYVYFVPSYSDTFVRFDTQGTFTTVGDWGRMNMSTAQGGAELNAAYTGNCFDGRYVYFVPYISDTFVRFDTQGVFTTVGDWGRMNMSTAQGGAELNAAYTGNCFDGRYVYFSPFESDSFVRFDTQGTFTTAGDWDRMSMSTAQGGAPQESAYRDTCFDGQYVYFSPYRSDTFIRFDTQGDFITSSDWDRMSMSTAQGGAEHDNAYWGTSFDGRYIYFAPSRADSFLKFDTFGNFTTAGDWGVMSMSTVHGSSEIDDAYRGASFDGRYIYFSPYVSDTFVRFEALWSGCEFP